jgi:hypothetical protein
MGLIRPGRHRLSGRPDLKGRLLEQSFHDTIVDYRFLEQRWNQIHPTAALEPLKTRALQALALGDVDAAWEAFAALPRPRPPGGLRVQSR